MNPVSRFFRSILGPAAMVAAGMIGAGAVSTRLLAGAWFRMELLWAALFIIPMVIYALDSASRITILSNHRGIIDLIRTDIHPAVVWVLLVPLFLVNVTVIMSQFSVMVESVYGTFGLPLPPSTASFGWIAVLVLMMGVALLLVLFGGFKRIEKILTWFLLFKLALFIVVAVKGLLDWQTWIELGRGLVPRIPQDIPVLGGTGVRDGFTQLMAIAGQALPASVFLSFGYLTSNANYTAADFKRSFRKLVVNSGFIYGTFSVVVMVAGATALNSVYQGGIGAAGETLLHYSQIDSVYAAGNVINPAFPSFLAFLAPRIFSFGLLAAGLSTGITVVLTMVYFALDLFGLDWRYSEDNKPFRLGLVLWIVVPALLAPLWKVPALIKAIFAMAGNLVLTPIVLAIIIYYVNKRSLMGEYRARLGRNVVLAVSLLFSLSVVIYGLMGLIAGR